MIERFYLTHWWTLNDPTRLIQRGPRSKGNDVFVRGSYPSADAESEYPTALPDNG